jgi:hypothetical protein
VHLHQWLQTAFTVNLHPASCLDTPLPLAAGSNSKYSTCMSLSGLDQRDCGLEYHPSCSLGECTEPAHTADSLKDFSCTTARQAAQHTGKHIFIHTGGWDSHL